MLSYYDRKIFLFTKYFYFFMWKLHPLPPHPPPSEKVNPLFPSNPPLKGEVLWSPPPFLKICLEVQTPPPNRNRGLGERGGEHYVLPVLKWIMAPKRAKCTYFSKSKFVALEQKLMQFAQYQHTGVQTWHCGYQTYQVQYEYKKSVDIGFWVTWRADS